MQSVEHILQTIYYSTALGEETGAEGNRTGDCRTRDRPGDNRADIEQEITENIIGHEIIGHQITGQKLNG